MPCRDVSIILSANLHHGPDWRAGEVPSAVPHPTCFQPGTKRQCRDPVPSQCHHTAHCRWHAVTVASAQPGHQQGRSTQTAEGRDVLGRVVAVCKLWLSLQGSYEWAEIMLVLLQRAGEIGAGIEGHFCLIWFLSSLSTLLCEK